MTILQIDRDAAAGLMEKLFGGVTGMESDLDWANTVRAGEDDNYPTVPAFASHREQSTRDLVGALTEAARYIEGYRDMPIGIKERINVALAKATANAR